MFGKVGLVGVDVGHYYTKVVEFERKKGVVSLVKVFKERTPEGVLSADGCDEVVLSEFLRSIFSEHKVKNRNVAFSINSSFVITKTLKMPLVVDEEIEQAVMWEAEQYAPVGIEEVNVSYQVLGKDENKKEMVILIAITKKGIIESYKSAFKRAKLKLEIVDVDVFSTSNAFLFSKPKAKDQHNLIVDLGYLSTKLVFLKDGLPTFTRYMDFNFSHILKEAKDVFNVKEEDVEIILSGEQSEKKEGLVNFFNEKLFVLYTQIRNSITFYNTSIVDIEEPINNIVFTGVLGVLYEYLSIERIRDILNGDVIQFNPFDFASKDNIENLDEVSKGTSSLYCVASGLSLRGVGSD